ncbi:hypothetical protein J7M22_12160 [Candidatus Poribacteria bacterium]|nr:hypothetical protein [Candidatus Poribacteria bacterium]
MKKIKVGIVGVGGIAQGAHIPNYQKILSHTGHTGRRPIPHPARGSA